MLHSKKVVNMKQYKLIGFLLSAFMMVSLSSCEDALEVETRSTLDGADIYSDAAMVEGVVTGIYDIFGQNNSYRNRLWLQLGFNTDIEYREGATLTAPKTISKADDYFALYAQTPQLGEGYNNNNRQNPWNYLYQGIERANLCLEGIRTYGDTVQGTDMGQLYGEALCLRAFFYFDLVKWWGDVPARFEPVNSATVFIGKTPREDIYNQLISDLDVAAHVMYSAGEGMATTTSRLSKESALALRARIALAAAGYSMQPIDGGKSEIKITVTEARRAELYEIARESCREVILSNIFSLDKSFMNVFYEQCKDIRTIGREAMYQLPYKIDSRGRMLIYFGFPREADINGNFNDRTIGGHFRVMPSFFYDYNAKDTRRDVTVLPYSIDANTEDAQNKFMEQSLSSITDFNIAKWRIEWTDIYMESNQGDDGVSPIILRYADVLLMFAEADLFLGGSEGELYFNMVRRRAFGVDINSASDYDLTLTLENLKKERAFEFCGENIRKYDLIRWGELKTAIDRAKTDMIALRDGTGKYNNVPSSLYYRFKMNEDRTEFVLDPLTNDRVLDLYGLNPGETNNKSSEEPEGGWNRKDWTNGFDSKTGEYYINDMYLSGFYHGDPDKRQLLPIMNIILENSNGSLWNDYGY